MLFGSDILSYVLANVQRCKDFARTSKMERDRPNFIHRSRSHLHEYRHGINRLFESRANSPGQAEMLSSAKPIEEETQPRYNPDAFYPAKLGEILVDRYKIVSKLGYGMTATVWLAKDLKA